MNFFGWKIDAEGKFKTYLDLDKKRLAVLTDVDDEIHLTIELDENDNLVMHPRWNINITIVGDKHLKLTTNFSVDE